MTNSRLALAAAVALTASLAAGGCGSGDETPPAGTECVKKVDEGTGKTSGSCLPVAPTSQRVDLAKPVFSNPTAVTNPLHPSSVVKQVIYGGTVDGKPFRTEFTLLPDVKTVTLDGAPVKAVALQFMALSDGRIEEVAHDWFAQADDGSVWYLGESVANYKAGVVTDTTGSWEAGKDGPAAMIMPAQPKVGDAYRPENAHPLVFEENTVKAAGQTVDGPYGPLQGAITVHELHEDGSTEDKVYAPGYGEFSTHEPGADTELVSLAVPTDAKPGAEPAQLTALSDAVRAAQGTTNEATVGAVSTAWDAYRAADTVPKQLTDQMNRDLGALTAAVKAKDSGKTRGAVLRVAQNTTDLQLRYQPLATVETERMNLWARQLTLDTGAKDTGAVAGDVTGLELTWARARPNAAADQAATIDARLHDLRAAADGKDAAAAAQQAAQLQAALAESHS